ncbi:MULTISPECIES: ureidoglycolate lyase [Halocynthiibacter]|uniref:Ureidoglycolate lyase n=1 Tax=Halocynthiibacter halioticoli TaxID=2986804 RepID=A0AAE3IZH0_9RHOB|nr:MULTISPECIES: ureidoglycolate lyase [Halocynthiibacter]MCV6824539.1 ureidoglycolate lyase [Halocynthiibacter halioticoli]MCW4057540.1 ureidoglycolate lyase [Halocynthiibacter sp. SDUM655004]
MSVRVKTQPLTAEAFAPFGDVIEASGSVDKLINQGRCERYHNRAKLDFVDGEAGISIFKSEVFSLPLSIEMMERHPEGSQAFLPLSDKPFLVVVAPDEGGKPGAPLAFITQPGQGVNYHRGVWHGVLTPLHEPGLFAVVDRIGTGPNLEEHWFTEEVILHE